MVSCGTCDRYVMRSRYDEPLRFPPAANGRLRERDTPPLQTAAVAACMGIADWSWDPKPGDNKARECGQNESTTSDAEQLDRLPFASSRGRYAHDLGLGDRSVYSGSPIPSHLF